MSWNYRIIKHIDEHSVWFAVHEVYYDIPEKGDKSWTENPIEFVGDTKKEVIKALEMALKDVKSQTILVDNSLT